MRKISPVCQFDIQFLKVTSEQMTLPIKALLFIIKSFLPSRFLVGFFFSKQSGHTFPHRFFISLGGKRKVQFCAVMGLMFCHHHSHYYWKENLHWSFLSHTHKDTQAHTPQPRFLQYAHQGNFTVVYVNMFILILLS